MNRTARPLLAAALASASLAGAQSTQTPVSPFHRYISRIDLGVSAMGSLNSSVSGTVPNNGAPDQGANISISPSNTVGALVNIRYTARPYFGLEFNYDHARYAETLTNLGTNQGLPPYIIQTGVDEASFGYLVTPPHPVLGLQPFASAGAGSTRFKPTAGGGNNAPTQWRATFYYNVGLQDDLTPHFGLRAAFRQSFFLAPDFLLNYLTILKRTSTVEPNIGVYLRF